MLVDDQPETTAVHASSMSRPRTQVILTPILTYVEPLNVGLAGSTRRIDAAPRKMALVVENVRPRIWMGVCRKEWRNEDVSLTCAPAVKVDRQRGCAEIWSLAVVSDRGVRTSYAVLTE